MHDSIAPGNEQFRTIEEWAELMKHQKIRYAAKENCLVARADCRKFLRQIPSNLISCSITSPPYGELKDYGSPNQIGYGQDLDKEYLPDLDNVFAELFRVTKHGGALWVVLDMLRKDGETVLLPWELISRAKAKGWSFHDLVIWDKAKSLPWPNPGRFRGVCEFILLFGKGKLATFNLNAVRDATNLSSYWVKYPERYHPDGKAPSDLWHFPIPNQGAWGGAKLNHQCPFPVGLVERMLSITSKPGELVLDPFAGTGIVPMLAGHLGRVGLGIEINSDLVSNLRKTQFKALSRLIATESGLKKEDNKSLRQLIIELRMQKYPKALYSALVRADELGLDAKRDVVAFLVTRTRRERPNAAGEIVSANLGQMCLQVLVRDGADVAAVSKAANLIAKRQPLSLYGLRVSIEVVEERSWSTDGDLDKSVKKLYRYDNGRFYAFAQTVAKTKFLESIRKGSIATSNSVPPIFSELKISVEPPPKDSISL